MLSYKFFEFIFHSPSLYFLFILSSINMHIVIIAARLIPKMNANSIFPEKIIKKLNPKTIVKTTKQTIKFFIHLITSCIFYLPTHLCRRFQQLLDLFNPGFPLFYCKPFTSAVFQIYLKNLILYSSLLYTVYITIFN